jgi:hypothetical protein
MKLDFKEKAITALFFTGIFLPIRLIFYSFVSEIWIGSFGLITGVLITVMYLAHKNKLGKLGVIVNRQIHSFSRGKLGLMSIISLVFVIYIYSLFIYGVENPPEIRKAEFLEVLEEEGVTDIESLSTSKNIGWSGPAASYGILFSILIMLIPNSIGFALYSIINDWTNGWMLHFATVFLIESLEGLGLILYFRFRNGLSIKN